LLLVIKDWAALDAFATLAFSRNSDLYEKLVVKEQKVDSISADMAQSVDPQLFSISARVKKVEDIPYVRQQILDTIEHFRKELGSTEKLAAIKSMPLNVRGRTPNSADLEKFQVQLVSGSYFPMLALKPRLGRSCAPS